MATIAKDAIGGSATGDIGTTGDANSFKVTLAAGTQGYFRAEEALRLFAEMGRVGQVIYFTHHQHLAEIAKTYAPRRECVS